MHYPIFLNIERRRVVVIGGGDVSERKVLSLLRNGAAVTVVSPAVTPGLQTLADSNAIVLHRRRYLSGDVAGAFLVFCATDDPSLHKAVWEETRLTGALVNTADDPAQCDFIAPAVVEQGDLTVAISTNGKSPALAAHVGARISGLIGPEYGELIELLAGFRAEIRRRMPDFSRRKELHYRIIGSGVLLLLQRGERAEAERLIRDLIDAYVQQDRPAR